jgi:hypothetical protein
MVASGVEIYPFHIQERGKDLTASEKPCQVGKGLAHLGLIIVQDSDKLNVSTTVNLE